MQKQGFNEKIAKNRGRTMSGYDANPLPEHPVNPREKKKVKAKRMAEALRQK